MIPFAAVTCTGGRPDLFALCKKWVLRQTRMPDLWIVVSDTGDEIADLPQFARFHHVPRMNPSFSGPGVLAPAWSLLFALGLVPSGHAAVVIEDDDWYSPKHCERLMEKIEEGAQLSYGDTILRFHVPQQRWRHIIAKDPIEGFVGIAPHAINTYCKSMGSVPRWDPKDGVYKGFTKVDIKGVGHGLPGRAGATHHHEPGHKKVAIMFPDPNNARFRIAVGEPDAQDYIRLVRR